MDRVIKDIMKELQIQNKRALADRCFLVGVCQALVEKDVLDPVTMGKAFKYAETLLSNPLNAGKDTESHQHLHKLMELTTKQG